MIGRVLQADPPISWGWVIEVGREVATLLMLGTVGWLAGPSRPAGYALVARHLGYFTTYF
jgi:hypothetical protein